MRRDRWYELDGDDGVGAVHPSRRGFRLLCLLHDAFRTFICVTSVVQRPAIILILLLSNNLRTMSGRRGGRCRRGRGSGDYARQQPAEAAPANGHRCGGVADVDEAVEREEEEEEEEGLICLLAT